MSDIDKKLADASKASNDFVQDKGPGAAAFIKKVLPWAALAIGVIFLAYALG